MIALGLSATDHASFQATLASSHRIRITVRIHDHNEKILHHLAAPKVVDGSVTVDASQTVTRSLSLTCVDPDHRLRFDSASPGAGSVFADNMISVLYGVYVPDITANNGWVDVPVFWGPCTLFERNGHEVVIEAQGKESLGLDPHHIVTPYTIHKGTTVKSAIRDVMSRLGETKFNLGKLSGNLSKARSVIREEQPWCVLVGGNDIRDAQGKKLPTIMQRAHGNYFLFYDGNGRLTAKSKNLNAHWTFTEDHLTSQPGFRYDVLAGRNYVLVEGGQKKSGHGHYSGHATLHHDHPLSAASLGRNGKPRYLVESYSSDSLKSDDACTTQAQTILDAKAAEGLEASFECLPIPHLEERDLVALNFDGYHLTFNLKQWTLPLTPDSAMSVGFTKSVRRPRNYS